METHVKVIGWAYIALGALGLLGAVVVIIAVAGGGFISNDRTAMLVTSLVSFLVGGFLILLSLPGVIAGIGLLKLKGWGRVLTLVLSILNLPAFPLGTMLGIYAIWALLDVEGQQLFTQ
jgi:hypothetical protein